MHVVEKRAQGAEGPELGSLDRAERHAKDRGDLRSGQPREPEFHDLALAFRQVRERLADTVDGLAGERLLLRIGGVIRGGQAFAGRWTVARTGGIAGGTIERPVKAEDVAAVGIDDGVVGDREEPGSDGGCARRAGAKGLQPLQGADEDLGRCIVGGVRIAEPAKAVATDGGVVAVVEWGEGSGIALGGKQGGEVVWRAMMGRALTGDGGRREGRVGAEMLRRPRGRVHSHCVVLPIASHPAVSRSYPPG